MHQPPNPYPQYQQQPRPQPNQFSRVFPSREDISHLKQPLTDGEWCLLQFLDDLLKKDELFQSNDLTKYNGWLIFVQPYLNGFRPDIVIFNPGIGVQIFEVKDWNLSNYSFETKEDGNTVFCVTDSKGTYPTKSMPYRLLCNNKLYQLN